MRIHHFFPRTHNVGDHFVQRGIETMVSRIVPEATFEAFDVNSRGQEKSNYGLTQRAVERANNDADLIIVGGSNLYEGAFRWPWGVHLDPAALQNLRVPLFLLGLGTGSSFASPLHRPSPRAEFEIKLLNDHAVLSGARDVTTFDWLQQLGVTKAKLLGDPATFIFNHPLRDTNRDGHVMITLPPLRMWSSRRQFWKVRTIGRATFSALIELARTLLEKGHQIEVVCNDPNDLPVAQKLFAGLLPRPVVCPTNTDEYFKLLLQSQTVISGRLHTAVVAFSLGIPFLLIDGDHRTNGFLKTYQLEPWSIAPSRFGVAEQLYKQAQILLDGSGRQSWQECIEKRDRMYSVAMDTLRVALQSIG
jgi:polysaccharide pyruvyl transferase WcaK-like protein